MLNQYSNQQLCEQFPEVLQQVERGSSIEITKEGKSVAIILSTEEYHRLISRQSSFWQALEKFRQHTNLEELEIDSDVFEGVRDSTPGREVI